MLSCKAIADTQENLFLFLFLAIWERKHYQSDVAIRRLDVRPR